MSSLVDLKCFNLFSKGDDTQLLLNHVNVSIDSGKLIALLGVNGCGKSTLMQAIAGKYSGWSGDLNWSPEFNKEAKDRSVALVGTSIDRSVQFTVEEVIKMGRHPFISPWKKLGAEDVELIRKATQQLSLTNKLDKLVGELSDGEMRRVFLAQALAQNPKLLLLDEPLNYLDVRHQYDMLLLMQHLTKTQDKSILFSTHHPELALQVVDEVWVFYNQNLISGSPEEILQNDMIEKVFGSDKIFFDKEQMRFRLKN